LRLLGIKKSRIFYGYIILAAAFVIQLVTWGSVNAFGIVIRPLQAEFAWSRAEVSAATSVLLLVAGFMSIILGSVGDRFGPRVVMTVCGILFGTGCLLTSLVNNIWQLYLFYGVIVGIGVSGSDVILLSTIARWFIKSRGVISGTVKVGTGVGILSMPLLASWLVSVYGWRTNYLVLGSLGFVSVVLLAQFLRRDPAQVGQLPNGGKSGITIEAGSNESGLSFREAVRTGQFWMLCAAFFTIGLVTNTILVHIAPHTLDIIDPQALNPEDSAKAALVLSIIGGTSIAGRLVMGNTADRFGNKRAMTVCFVILVISMVWLQFANQLWMIYLFSTVYGFAHGGFFALMSPIVAGLFGTRYQGILLGSIIFTDAVGGAIGPLVAGYLFDIMDSYQVAFLIFLGVSVVGLVLISLLKPIRLEGGIHE
jgi:MFS family permease